MQKQWMKVSCAAAAALALAAPLSGYAMPRVADAGLVMMVTGEANRLLANDQAVITFTAEAQRPQAQDASDEIIKAGNAAIAALNAINAPAGQVEVQTADFSTWPVRTRAKEGETSEIAAWGARQTLRVTVRDLKLASAVMSAAGKSMNYDGVTFSVSRAVREAAQDELLAEAVKRATERAVTAAQALGLEEKNVRIEGIQVSGAAGPSPRYYAQPMMMRAAAANDSAEAVVSAGSADTALTVSLTVRITP